MWAILQTDHIPGAHHLWPRCSDWWRENKHYQKVAHPSTEAWSFLGFTKYYCWFIPKFLQTPCPLCALMSGERAGKKRVSITSYDRCQPYVDELKHLCTTAPILAYADFTGPFKLHTNACGSGLGTVLYQTCTDTITSYASRSLTKAKMHYPAHKLEFLALKWAVVEKSHEDLYGSTFDIHTDKNPLTYILTTVKLDAVSHHWVASLVNYNFKLYYKVGKGNINVDALSRVSWPICMLNGWGTQHQITAVEAMWEATLKGPASLI